MPKRLESSVLAACAARKGSGTIRFCRLFGRLVAGQVLKPGVDPDVFGRLDTESNPVAADLQDSNLDIVGDDDFLKSFPADNKYSAP
jgi:hypothetical protein